MNPFIPAHTLGTSFAMAGLAGAAAGLAGANRSQPLEVSTVDGQLWMPLNRELQDMLDIEVDEDPWASREPRAVRSETSALEDMNDLLLRRMADVRRWLNLADMQPRLSELGVTIADVEAELQRVARNALDFLGPKASRGAVVFPLVPSADALFRESLRGAERSLWAGTTPVSTTSTAVGSAPLPEIGVDLVKRAAALQALAGFAANFLSVLPQLQLRRLRDTWRFANGIVEFMDKAQCAASFPCATSPQGGTDGTRCTASYPEEWARGVNVRQALIRGNPVVLARPDGAGPVLICTDGSTWEDTGFYTDDEVERAKAEVWREVLATGDTIYQHTLETGLWRRRRDGDAADA